MAARAAILASLAVLLVLPLGACGTASAPSPPAGVDELVVPTPSPDPADFVASVDNPWFPLEAGAAWTYDVADAAGTHRLRVSVEPGPALAGVATTARVSTEQGERIVDWFAQDEGGNVWWFGREGVWRAGAAGALAGLAMPATPRVGDGYRSAYAEGVVEDWQRVESVADDVLVVERRSDLDPGAAAELTFERGIGQVGSALVDSAYRVERLTSP